MKTDSRRPLHVLTLTPFYPSRDDDAIGCFVSEPLAWLAKMGVRNTVFAVQPLYRRRHQANDSGVSADWLHCFALPGAFSVPIADAFVFALMSGEYGHFIAYSPLI